MADKSQRDEILEKDEQTQVIEEQEEVIEEEQEEIKDESEEIIKLKELLARHQADCDNFKKRMERDKQDMIFFLKSDIISKILPRVDDLERIIANTPLDLQDNALFTWVQTLYKSLSKDLEKLWVKIFESKWESVDPDKHDVMTQVPWKAWIIIDEFEKGYVLEDRVLRHARVVVGSGE